MRGKYPSIRAGTLPSREGGDARGCAVAVLEEVPRLDDVALRVLEVQRVVTALVAERPAVLDPERAQAVADRDQLAVIDGEREVDVAASAVAELLVPGRPQPEPGPLPSAEPDPVVLLGQHWEVEDLRVELGEGPGIGRFKRQLADPPGPH
jgi:hypothetical protein